METIQLSMDSAVTTGRQRAVRPILAGCARADRAPGSSPGQAIMVYYTTNPVQCSDYDQSDDTGVDHSGGHLTVTVETDGGRA
jgi:hypothetical protein